MSSISARIAGKLMRVLFSGWSDGTVAQQRARQARGAGLSPLPKGIRHRPVAIDGIPGEWIEGPDAGAGVLLYLHGGAYVLGSVAIHRELIARLALATRTRALAIDYRLAPEHPYPAALEDLVRVYRWLLQEGYDPARIFIAGDSAGGGLTVAGLIHLRDSGDRLPAGGICISPWVDLTLSGQSVRDNARLDPILDPASLAMYAEYYRGSRERSSPQISPLFADLRGLPPLLIQVGANEILLDDAVRLVERARQAGVDSTLEAWDGLFHVFHLFAFLPETRQAVDSIARFVAANSA